MSTDKLHSGLEDIRKLVLYRQHLSPWNSNNLGSNKDLIEQVIYDICHVQVDPVRYVERSHILTLWSRIGPFKTDDLFDLIYKKRKLVEFYTSFASIVHSSDLPLIKFKILNNRKREADLFLKENQKKIADILNIIRKRQSVLSRDMDEIEPSGTTITGWGNERTVNLFLERLYYHGKIWIIGRDTGNQKIWGLPPFQISSYQNSAKNILKLTKKLIERSAISLGTGTKRQIMQYHALGNSDTKVRLFDELVHSGKIKEIEIDGIKSKETWYIHRNTIEELHNIRKLWKPRTAILSPFDNLLHDRKRTMTLFGFDSRLEMYLPKSKRKYGYYSMPVLHNGELVGRIEPKMDRTSRILKVISFHPEKKYEVTNGMMKGLVSEISSLGKLLGAENLELHQSFYAFES
ncbi:MAG: winged helix DNA-binding domain-containing protein [Candidatus Thermoplasmatota archaeon]|nr:winged helix DNA-binding domain-containing protein [Candidatus Thermoplasmatota archaeon]